MMNPNARGDRTAASADPVFMNPLAVPEYCGAISIGNRPHRADDDLGEEEGSRQAHDDERQIVCEEDWKHADERPEKRPEHEPASRLPDVTRASQDGVADDTAKIVAANPCGKHR